MFIPTLFLKSEGDIVITSVCLPVRTLCYLLNNWTKFNQIWSASYSHEWGAQRPRPLGRGQKVKYLISIPKSISKIFHSNALYVHEEKMVILFVCFVALRPKSTAMVIAGRSVHLTTLFPGQA